MNNINLENAWCKTTQENYDALIKLGYEPRDNITNAFRKDFETHLRIESDTIVWGHKKCIGAMENPDYWSKDREIHLVNGEFEYVIQLPKSKNNFKEYGFEAHFEGEISFESQSYYVGFVREDGRKFPRYWTKNLVCFNPLVTSWQKAELFNSDHRYNLKPIKKEWYENPDNFPCVIISLKTNKPHIAYNYNHLEEKIKQEQFSSNPDKFRPATKEEVLSLLVKE